MIRDNYKGDLTDEQLVQGALKGMLGLTGSLHYILYPERSRYLHGLCYRSLRRDRCMPSNSAVTIYVVTKVFQASPAEKAGILQGDKFVEADGKSLVKAYA